MSRKPQEYRLPHHRPSPLKLTACLLAGLCTLPSAQAESVACHLTYGGETRLIETQPTTSPYSAPATAIGSYFLFRVVFRQQPADLAGIKIYTYANHDSGPALIHQTSHAWPVHNTPGEGFTGQQAVHEPLRDGELQYWCEIQAGA